ncbi:MAG: YbaB/EbfC family nucleoid-associated protein [Armatimonadetes bacterium]|nr:YbaB/EbfC family nucleoid-associated protein [Armatimonadota bacterium]
MHMFNMQKMLKQAQKVQEEMARVQEELGKERLEATSGGGVVKVVANGHGDLLELHIDPAAVDPQDVSMLEDLIVAAVNEAQRAAREMSAQKMKALTGGFQIPGLT